MVDFLKVQGHFKFAIPTSALEFVVSWYGRLRKFHGHCKFGEPTSSLDFLCLCMLDFANFNHTVSL